ncbi:hypothetical protein HU200_058278 [Digitaria exilis]|uniref:Uncharacterized protein n=1 Tax=Digitaria exilis TaxID=1010633 RepID=A0A835E256_9POAL|nr:hypothetical protein HU200_058278 [Digitaria exilis]
MILSFSTWRPNICPSTKMFVGRGCRIGWQSCKSMMNSLRSPHMPCKFSWTLSIS